jgi:hypothetical protein
VRQLLIGKRYFQSRFGVDVHIGWNREKIDGIPLKPKEGLNGPPRDL